MGFRVKYDDLDKLADGQWVEDYGTLNRLDREAPDPGLQNEGLHLIVLNESYILMQSKIVTIQQPEIPFIFDFRDQEPYAY